MPEAVTYRVSHEYVAVRAARSTAAHALDFKRRGQTVAAARNQVPDEDGWLAIHVGDEDARRYGTREAYMLTDGAMLGLPVLLTPTTPAPAPAAAVPAPPPPAPPPPSKDPLSAVASSTLARLQRAQALALAAPPHPARADSASAPIARIYATSDIHTDHEGNMDLVTKRWDAAPPGSVLIVAGDVSHVRSHITKTFAALREKFDHVFFVPGNHDLWVFGSGENAGGPQDSVELLGDLAECLGSLGVKVLPTRLPRADGAGDVCVAPLYSWYNSTFLDQSRKTPSSTEANFDTACKWPVPVGVAGNPRQSYGVDTIARFMAELNAPFVEEMLPNRARRRDDDARRSLPVVLFSHFYPRPELYYGYNGLAKVMGSTDLEDQAGRIRPDVHVFGHAHLDVDRKVGGTRYVQHALGYPKDRAGDRGPKLVWSCV